MVVYEVIECRGLGVMESPTTDHPTGLIYLDKPLAEKVANDLWLKKTTLKDRQSGWCPLHFTVKEIEVIEETLEQRLAQQEKDVNEDTTLFKSKERGDRRAIGKD